MGALSKAAIDRYGLLDEWWTVDAQSPGGTDGIWYLAAAREEALQACSDLALSGWHHVRYTRQRTGQSWPYRLPWGTNQAGIA